MVAVAAARRAALVAALVAAGLVRVAAGADRPPERRLAARRASSPILVDGVLGEPAWDEAPVASHFVQNDPREGEPATYDTEVRVLYDDENLYFGVVAYDDEPDKIIVNDIKRDFSARSGDVFGVVLDTFHDRRNGYVFETNPAGAKFDAQFVNEGREFNMNWDGVWSVRARVTEIGWTAEIAIPFKTLRFRGEPSQTWGVNFLRRIRRLNEDSYWAPIPRIHRIARVSLAGTLEGLRGLRPRRDVKVTPYVKGDMTESAAAAAAGDLGAGVDAKLAVGSGLRLDLTWNTDFSQVEADVQQINLTRFSLFFPEKRDFFLENSGIFRFGPPPDPRIAQFQASFGDVASSSNLRGGQSRGDDLLFFFSRRIGLSEDGRPLPVRGGGRLTGRVGDWELGVLGIATGEDELAGPGEVFSVLRLRRNVLASSDVGVIFIDREGRGAAASNRGLGVDANFRLSEEMDLNAYLAKTWTPGLRGDDLAGRLGWSYDGRLLQLRTAVSTLEDNFNPEVGFAPRIGVRRASGFFGYHYRQSWWTDVLREINPHVEAEYFTDQAGVVVSRYFNVHLSFRLQNGGFVELGRNTSLEQPAAAFAIHPTVTIPAGFYTFDEDFVMVFTDPSRALSGNARVSSGGFYSGDRKSVSLGGVLRIGEKLAAQASWSWNDIELLEGAFTTQLLTTRFTYNFSTRLFLNALVQYNSVTGEWNSNVRLNLIHRPLSDFFVVYNDRRDEAGRRLDRALIVKYTHLLSF